MTGLQEPGFIYLLKPDRMPYKIGIARNVEQRLKQIGVKLPFPPKLVHSVQTNDVHRAELAIHRRFADKRLEGEWFDLSDEDVEWFCSLTSWDVPPPPPVAPTPVSDEWLRRALLSRDAAQRLGVSQSRVRQLIGAHRLSAVLVGRDYFIAPEEVERLARELAEEAESGKKPGPKPNVTKLAARVAELEGRDGAE